MRFTLHLATYGLRAPVPAQLQESVRTRVPVHFARGSRRARQGPPGIELVPGVFVDRTRVWPGERPVVPVLNRVLAAMTGRQARGRADQIGLIFAARHPRDAGLFGLLFDPGFDPWNVQVRRNRYHAVPREGCVVYLDAIRARRHNLDDFKREVLFTSIHELGHVFNLWHEQTESFMFRSATLQRPISNPGAWNFTRLQKRFLRQLPLPMDVRPGGTPFGVRGSHWPRGRSLGNAPSSDAALDLHIDIRPREFWYFEPVELEVTLSLAKGRRRPAVLPNEIDAGYHRFQIWIDEPDGTRRRYKAPVRYCGGGSDLRVEYRKPFRRDISIFGQSGGFTFRMAGRHTITAYLQLPSGRVIRSQAVEVDLKTADTTREYELLEEALTSRRVGRLLYYRKARQLGAWVDELDAFARAREKTHVGARLLYALGRAELDAGVARGSRGAKPYERGRERLARAAQAEGLGTHQRRIAERTLEKSADA